MLELKDASLARNGQQLFANLSFMALDGQITTVTGPRGCGKTALLQTMLGLLALDEGLVSIDGELLTPLSAPTFRRMMAYVPQNSLSPGPSPVGKGDAAPEVTPPYGGGAGGEAGLETVWSPYNSRHYQPTPIEEPLDLPPMASKQVIVADEPDAALWATLRQLAAAGRTVVAATTVADYLNQSDKIITLGKHDTVIS